VLVATVLVPTRPAEGAFPGADGVIAFGASIKGQGDICTMNSDGSNAIVLVDGPVDDEFAVWSPDGSKLAYNTYRVNRPSRIKVLDLRTGTTVDLAPGWKPAWSPDGARIAFLHDEPELGAVWVMNSNGTDRHLVNGEPGKPWDQVTWTPDGSALAITAASRYHLYPEQLGIWLIAPDGSNLRKISEGQDPSFSPDGTRMVVSYGSSVYDDASGPSGLWVMNADGSNRITLLEDPSGEDVYVSPAWSPSGETIAYTFRGEIASGRIGSGIWMIDATGGTPRDLRSTRTGEGHPDWQPITTTTPSVPQGKPCIYELAHRAVSIFEWEHNRSRGRLIFQSEIDWPTRRCAEGRVALQRRTPSGWVTLLQGRTDEDGWIFFSVRDRPGRFRTKLAREGICSGDISDVLVHRH
jgi:TolB protein